jgi:glycine/D-amino acid oxidase-like deaminating enzyme
MSGPMVLDIGASSGFYAVPPRQGLGLKIGDHRFSLAGDPNGDRIPTEAEIKTVLDQCRRRLRDFARYRVVTAKVCFYDLAPAERFVIEPVGSRVWAMTGFSGHGFKFAPILAERLADAIDGVMTPAALGLWAAGLAA